MGRPEAFRSRVISLLFGLGSGLAAAIVAAAAVPSPVITTFALAAFVFLVILALTPLSWLPSIALAVSVLLPVGFVPIAEIFTILSPAVLVVLVWLIRVAVSREVAARRRVRFSLPILFVLCVWLAAGILLSEFPGNGLAWSFSFALLVIAPIMVGFTSREAEILIWTLVCLSIPVALFGLVEYLLKDNLIFGSLYASGRYPILQKWATYRITTSLGHPLDNAVFFAGALAASVGLFLKERRTILYASALLSSIGILLTGSRGGFLAGCVTIAGGVTVAVFSGRRTLRLKFAVSVVTAAITMLMASMGPLLSRSQSDEGVASVQERYVALDLSVRAARGSAWLGTGPGSSSPATADLANRAVVIESSYLQLLVSIGVPGLLLLCLLVAIGVRVSLNRRNWPGLFVLLSTLVAVAFFNFIEANRPYLFAIGSALAVAMAPSLVTFKEPRRSDII